MDRFWARPMFERLKQESMQSRLTLPKGLQPLAAIAAISFGQDKQVAVRMEAQQRLEELQVLTDRHLSQTPVQLSGKATGWTDATDQYRIAQLQLRTASSR